jgi:hypothetical protein
MRVPRRPSLLLLGGLFVAALLFPAQAAAHGIVGRANLPIPVWLFSWAAAIVLVVSFVALSTLWMKPQLQQQHRRRLMPLPQILEWPAGVFGVGVFALVVYSGFAGAQVYSANFSVTFVYVIFWVGVPVASVLVGDVFRPLNPWRACARVLWWTGRRLAPRRLAKPPLRYPEWLGMWPAITGLVGFAWLELVYVNRDEPSILAALSLAWFVAMLFGMLLFGVEDWSEQGDAFGVYFSLFSRLSPLVRDEQGFLCARRPLSGLPDLPIRRGTVALICTMIGSTTFDGFSNGGIWRNNEPGLAGLFEDLGFHLVPAQELAYSLALVLCILLIAGVYWLGILGVHSVSERYDTETLTHTFVHTLVPIAFAYVLAHYFSYLLWQSQALGYLISDPLGNGADIFGTSGAQIDYHIVSYAAIWYVEVAVLLGGHVGGLMLAHDRALVLYEDPVDAVRSQYWMLAVMVAFTSFGLWLLSSVGT